eukprot:gene22666-29351_t
MTIQVTQKFPNIAVKIASLDGVKNIETNQLFAGKKSILFAVPGAFTPVCSMHHLPDFAAKKDAFKAVGIDKIICLSVNDSFVMQAWADHLKINGAVDMLCDGNGHLTKELGMEIDLSAHDLGLRSKRYAMIVEDGIVTHLEIEESPSSCSRQWDINLRTPLGTEVLLRIPSPTDKQLYLSTSYWIDCAESNDKLEELSYKILTKLIKNTHLLNPYHIPYYINIPPPIVSVALVNHIKTLLDQVSLPYHFIGVELTERQPIIDYMQFRRGIDALQQLKMPVALDDYGRGYATMQFLRDFHVDRVKIDRGLLHDAKNNLSKRLTLVSLLDFATEFDIEVIAEGVETESDHAFVRKLNCDGVQGFYSGAPKILVDIVS